MMVRKLYTLVFVQNTTNLLLGLKKRGFGEGKWNGFGGKVEQNETIVQGAIRELKEECNIEAASMKHLGALVYQDDYPEISIVHVFTTDNFTGTPQESEEMRPHWYNIDNIPFEKMWPDARLWFPLMLENKYFTAHVQYTGNEIHNHLIREYSSLQSALQNVN